jgi:Family of unknown function (DUF5683)
MMKFLLSIAIILVPLFAVCQDTVRVVDTSGTVVPSRPIATNDTLAKKDSVAKRKFSPRSAAIRSAIFPGLGQIYNKKYWKVPIVWAAVGIPIGLFFDNKKWYDRTKYALAVVASTTDPPNQDSLNRVHAQLRPLVDSKAQSSLLRYRNEFRKNMDYSILFTLLIWGLNIVDATVDAHLKGFNVSDDLTLKPVLLPGNTPGLSLVFSLGKNHSNAISSSK